MTAGHVSTIEVVERLAGAPVRVGEALVGACLQDPKGGIGIAGALPALAS